MWTTPATPAALLSYLLGPWTLTKTLTYTRGGLSGTFRGDATFMPVAGSPRVLAYEEKGKVTLEPDMESFDARHALLYRFGEAEDGDGGWRVAVFFDDGVKREPAALAASMLAGERLFHSIDIDGASTPFQPPTIGMEAEVVRGERPFNQPGMFHPCGPDVYRGRLLCTDPDLFVLDWKVEGPRKLGRIVSRFSRVPDISTDSQGRA